MLRQSKITAFFRPQKSETNSDSNDLKTMNSSSAENKLIKINKSNNNLSFNTKRKFNESELVNDINVSQKHLKAVKKCPFYKRIPKTCFAVDAFSYGSIPDISTYFLTHFHADHYQGLNKSFKHIIYCSPITASLVRLHYKNCLFTIKEIAINESEVIDGTKVTFFDANHCPGAVLILFQLNNGLRYLHTGDFRASLAMHSYPQLISKPIDIIFLDTTYCNPKYDFPKQKTTLEMIVSISSQAFNKNQKLLIVCGSYSIGKENVFISIAKALNINVWTDFRKQQIYKCYKNPTINSLLVSNKFRSKLHVLPMNNINNEFLEKYLQTMNGIYTEILAFRPTGWTFSNKSLDEVKPHKSNNVSIYGVPYSEHSSFSELQRFITFFKPSKVIPTVNNGKEENRIKMNEFIQKWINSSNDFVDLKIKKQINGSLNSWIKMDKKSTEHLNDSNNDIVIIDD